MIANDCWLFFWFIQFFFSYKWLNLEHNFVTFLMFVIHNVLWCRWKTPDVDDQSLQCHQSRYQHTWLKSIHQDQSRRYYTGSTIFISICTLTLSVLTASKSKWYAALSIIWVMYIIFSPSTRVKKLKRKYKHGKQILTSSSSSIFWYPLQVVVPSEGCDSISWGSHNLHVSSPMHKSFVPILLHTCIQRKKHLAISLLSSIFLSQSSIIIILGGG